jgi:putative copper export protein
MWDSFLQVVEFSALGAAARGSVWLYPLANLMHVVGASLLVGAIVVFDLMLLRNEFARASDVSRVALGVAATGLAFLLLSGPVMFSAEATAFGRNPVFLAKMILILAGFSNLVLYHLAKRRPLIRSPVPPGARLHAAISAGVWILAVIAGRSIAYV